MADARILIVEDDSIIGIYIQDSLKLMGYAVAAVTTSGEEAIRMVAETHPDLVLMDIKLPGMDGTQAAERIRARFGTPVVYLTAYDDENTLRRAKVTEPYGYLHKPFKDRELRAAIEIALYKHKLEQRLRHYTERLRIVHEIDRAILAAQSPEAIAQAALGHIRALVPCLGAGIVMFDFKAREATVLAADVSDPLDIQVGACFPLEEFGNLQKDIETLRQGKVYVMEDISILSSPPPLFRALPAGGLRSYVGVPLMAHGELIGFLTLGSERSGGFASEHLDIARELADSLAIAIQNARLFQSVAQQREQLRALTARLAEVEEAERQQLARELHDRVGQNLTALSINLNIIRSQAAGSVAGLDARLDGSLRLVEETVEHIRNVMAVLRPPVLDDYGLLAALRWYGERLLPYTDATIVVEGEELSPRLPLSVEMALFRIAQEALTNVVKHARAGRVMVTLEAEAKGACLTIADDGMGFDSTTLRQPAERPGWGVITMRERAESVGGHLRVESAPGKGTQVVVHVPR